MNTQNYRQPLNDQIISTIGDSDWGFQQDNAPIHLANANKSWFNTRKLSCMVSWLKPERKLTGFNRIFGYQAQKQNIKPTLNFVIIEILSIRPGSYVRKSKNLEKYLKLTWQKYIHWVYFVHKSIFQQEKVYYYRFIVYFILHFTLSYIDSSDLILNRVACNLRCWYLTLPIPQSTSLSLLLLIYNLIVWYMI